MSTTPQQNNLKVTNSMPLFSSSIRRLIKYLFCF